MKIRTKHRKSLLRSHSQPTLNKLLAIEEDIITSHINELSHEEAIAVAKIKEDSNFFFWICKEVLYYQTGNWTYSILIMVV